MDDLEEAEKELAGKVRVITEGSESAWNANAFRSAGRKWRLRVSGRPPRKSLAELRQITQHGVNIKRTLTDADALKGPRTRPKTNSVNVPLFNNAYRRGGLLSGSNAKWRRV